MVGKLDGMVVSFSHQEIEGLIEGLNLCYEEGGWLGGAVGRFHDELHEYMSAQRGDIQDGPQHNIELVNEGWV